MPGVRSMPAEHDLRSAMEADIPLCEGVLLWPPAWLVLNYGDSERAAQSDLPLMSDLEETLVQQVRWIRQVHEELGGALYRRSVTDVLTDTVIEWACSRMPPIRYGAGVTRLLRFQPFNPHGVYAEVHLPLHLNGTVASKACDLVIMRHDAPDLVIEIDRKNNADAIGKLAIARDA